MDSRDLFSDQDPPAAAALYLSALDHEQHYSAAELWQAVFRAQAAAGRPAELSQLYRQSTLGADASEYDVRARRSWALDMARHLTLDGGRPADAEPHAWAAAWEEPAAAPSGAPHTPSPSPSHHPAPQSYAGSRQTTALRELRTARRRPARVAAAVVVAQMSGVVLANEAPGVMAIAWAGPLNIGLGLVLAQVVLTGWAILWYARYAGRRLEPLVKRHHASFPHLESHR
ncbi:DUF485 domain-containing protein [Streptomyces sp. MB09-02B]|uniref:DUF485 domain-containing protein n=1 Tax=Streptomyces sp. MB09-02B TaxID=3028667 RepID=UPI0029B9A962|nr:DUF485 domain-containing protein [Streptomyces sp. MB09-02B]MDX3638332.1 DUF485 domain-containing protein [Streptomyces sp. MB09-02B]